MLITWCSQVEQIVQEAGKPGIKVTMELIGKRPAGKLARNPSACTAGSAGTLQDRKIQPDLTIGSTDANIPLSLGLPAVTIGLSTGFGAHTRNEYIQTQPLANGLAQLIEVVGRGVFPAGVAQFENLFESLTEFLTRDIEVIAVWVN